jgi:hypothetical protein
MDSRVGSPDVKERWSWWMGWFEGIEREDEENTEKN